MYYWEDWINAVAPLLEYQVTDATVQTPTDVADFNNSLPAAVAYTENRLQRDLDLLFTEETISTGKMTANSRTVTLPSTNLPAVSDNPQLVGTPIPADSTVSTTASSNSITIGWTAHGRTVGQSVSILNPIKLGGLTLGGVYQILSVPDADTITIGSLIAATSSASGTIVGDGIFIVVRQIACIVSGVKQTPLEPVTRDFLEYAWPSDTSPGANIQPAQWCPKNQTSILVGPPPDQAYSFEAVGTMRIVPLSAANYTNPILQQFFDLYVVCSLIYFSMYQRELGQATSNPDMGTSYEAQYQALLKSAQVEEQRKKFMNMVPSPSYPIAVSAKTQGG